MELLVNTAIGAIVFGLFFGGTYLVAVRNHREAVNAEILDR